MMTTLGEAETPGWRDSPSMPNGQASTVEADSFNASGTSRTAHRAVHRDRAVKDPWCQSRCDRRLPAANARSQSEHFRLNSVKSEPTGARLTSLSGARSSALGSSLAVFIPAWPDATTRCRESAVRSAA